MDTGLSDSVVNNIVDTANKYNIEKVILFGSRSRGDYYRASDIDLAAYGDNIAEFRLELEEKAPTLLTFDVVDLKGNPSKSILDTISKEGKVLYEKI